MLKKNVLIFVVGTLMAFFIVPGLQAAEFPAKDITLVCPWSAGGGTDTISRALVKNAKKYFGVNVNVVNKTGGMAPSAWGR